MIVFPSKTQKYHKQYVNKMNIRKKKNNIPLKLSKPIANKQTNKHTKGIC